MDFKICKNAFAAGAAPQSPDAAGMSSRLVG